MNMDDCVLEHFRESIALKQASEGLVPVIVEAGQALGTVSDSIGERVETVPSQESGIVITLRTFPRVGEQDTLAVVLEVDSREVCRIEP